MAKKLEIELIKSTIHQLPAKRATVRSLGLRKINSKTIKEDNPAMRGMVAAVQHLVSVKEID